MSTHAVVASKSSEKLTFKYQKKKIYPRTATTVFLLGTCGGKSVQLRLPLSPAAGDQWAGQPELHVSVLLWLAKALAQL